MLDQVDEIVSDYRDWLFSVLTDSEEDKTIKEQIKKKMKCEDAGMSSHGAVCIDGMINYFGIE